jgi:DNA-binding transcriptional regulator YdaS (Cro superfamily)
MDPLKKAISHLGSQVALAAALGVVPQAVHNWIRRGNIPAEHCPKIERATHGAVRCEDLRPDMDWAYLRGTTDALPPEVASKPPETAPQTIPALSRPTPPVHQATTLGEPRLGSDRRDDERRKPDPRAADRREDERRQQQETA